eukprot:gene15299-15441_t
MSLTDVKIKNTKPDLKPFKLSDARGLYLLVNPNGSKLWRFKYRVGGKEKLLAIGAYPDIGLGTARRMRDEARTKVAEGGDPSGEKQIAKQVEIELRENTFRAIGDEYIDKLVREGRAQTTIEKLKWLLDMAYKGFGDSPIKNITPPQVLKMLREIEKRGTHDSAKRLQSTVGAVFRYGVATARADSDPTYALKGALTRPTVVHRPAITDKVALGGLLRAIDAFSGQATTVAALKLLALLAPRPGELRFASWMEFDLDAAAWTIPASRMKMRREQKVPLPTQAIEIIRDLRGISGQSRLLFPSMRTNTRPMSENTINGALRRLGYAKDEATAHGFRATFSTLANESGLWNPDAIERALAHTENNEVRRAYQRAEFWDERVRMAQWWADFLDELRGLQAPYTALLITPDEFLSILPAFASTALGKRKSAQKPILRFILNDIIIGLYQRKDIKVLSLKELREQDQTAQNGYFALRLSLTEHRLAVRKGQTGTSKRAPGAGRPPSLWQFEAIVLLCGCYELVSGKRCAGSIYSNKKKKIDQLTLEQTTADNKAQLRSLWRSSLTPENIQDVVKYINSARRGNGRLTPAGDPKVKKQYGLSNTSLYDMISRGTFPRPIRIGERSVAVPQAWLDAWLESRVFKRHNRHNVLGDANELEALMPLSERSKPLKPIWLKYKRRCLGGYLRAGASPEIAEKLSHSDARHLQAVASSSPGGDERMLAFVTAYEEALRARCKAEEAMSDFYKIAKPSSRDYLKAKEAVDNYLKAQEVQRFNRGRSLKRPHFFTRHLVGLPETVGISTAPRGDSRNWTRENLSSEEVIRLLSTHQVGEKFGEAYTPALFEGSRRLSAVACQVDLVIFDCDKGLPLKFIKFQLDMAGLAGLIVSSHSHGMTQTMVEKSVWAKFQKRVPNGSADDYLRHKGFDESVCVSATLGFNDDGDVIISHPPIEKYRIIMWPMAPWKASNYRGQEEAKAAFAQGLERLAKRLRLKADSACYSVEHYYFLPRCREGAVPVVSFVEGGLVDCWSLTAAQLPRRLMMATSDGERSEGYREATFADMKPKVFDGDFKTLSSAVKGLKNDSRFDDRPDWIKIGAAIHFEAGGSEDGFTLFDDLDLLRFSGETFGQFRA